MSRKFPSSAIKRAYKNLDVANGQRKKSTEYEMSHSLAAGARFQSGGKLIPGCGHAGQSRASSPGFVPSIPPSSCPRPPRFNPFKFRHWRMIRMNSSYRSWESSVKKKELEYCLKRTYSTRIHTNVVSVPGKRVAKLVACAL